MGDVIRARTRFWVAGFALLALWGVPAEVIESRGGDTVARFP